MPLLSDKDRKTLMGMFAQELVEPVKIVYFGQEIACQYCKETQAILEEVAGLSDKIELEINNFVIDKEKADAMGVDKIPATVLLGGGKDHGVRFFGIPSGYEFTSLIQDIIVVSKGQAEFSPEALAMIARITQPVHIQVYITPT
jgi:glutaredoxin-like protein